MARHRPTFGMVERDMMEGLFQPEVLRRKVPRMDEIQDGAALVRELNDEINTLGKFQRANGFLGNRSMQHVAKIDSSLMVTIDELHKAGCECGRESVFGSDGHKQWFYDWLALPGPREAHDVRGKIKL